MSWPVRFSAGLCCCMVLNWVTGANLIIFHRNPCSYLYQIVVCQELLKLAEAVIADSSLH